MSENIQVLPSSLTGYSYRIFLPDILTGYSYRIILSEVPVECTYRSFLSIVFVDRSYREFPFTLSDHAARKSGNARRKPGTGFSDAITGALGRLAAQSSGVKNLVSTRFFTLRPPCRSPARRPLWPSPQPRQQPDRRPSRFPPWLHP